MMIFYNSDLTILVQHVDGDPQITPTTYAPAKYLKSPNGVIFPLNGDDAEVIPTDVTVLKACAKLTARCYRDAVKATPFTYNGVSYDSGAESRENIAAASLLATQATMLQQPFSIDWTDAAGNPQTLDGPQMMGLGQAAAVHVQIAYYGYKASKATIDTYTTVGEVLGYLGGITWPTL